MSAIECTVVECNLICTYKCRHRLVLRGKSYSSGSLVLELANRQKHNKNHNVLNNWNHIAQNMYLETDTKSNEMGRFYCKCGRFLIINRAHGPDKGCFSFPISSHEYIRLIFRNVHLFSAIPQFK